MCVCVCVCVCVHTLEYMRACNFGVLSMKNNANDSCANGYHFTLVNRTQPTNGGLQRLFWYSCAMTPFAH